jgi:predicted AAA+ superfamily ATPase
LFWEKLSCYDAGAPLLLDSIFKNFSDFGGYPFCHANNNITWEVASDHLINSVVKRTIDHDLRTGKGHRDSRLLKEVFRMAVIYTGQAVTLRKMAVQLTKLLGTNITEAQINDCLEFLENSLLLKLIEPSQLRNKTQKSAKKICICDHAIRAAWLREVIQLYDTENENHNIDLAGHIIESIIGYFLSTIKGIGVTWFPERHNEPEVDYVLEIGQHRIPIEVKYRPDPFEHIAGLRSYIGRKVYNAKFGLIITKNVSEEKDNIVAIPAKRFLLLK